MTDPRCADDRSLRALHEAAHAVVAALIGFDFDSVTLPEADDAKVGLAFTRYDLQAGESGDAVSDHYMEARITMRLAGDALESELCGAVRFAGQDILDAQADSAAVTDDPEDAAEIRKRCRARARRLVESARDEIDAVAAALMDQTTLDWSEVAAIVLGRPD